eukprot:4490623-Pleurochrysis_carterae.AAC.3
MSCATGIDYAATMACISSSKRATAMRECSETPKDERIRQKVRDVVESFTTNRHTHRSRRESERYYEESWAEERMAEPIGHRRAKCSLGESHVQARAVPCANIALSAQTHGQQTIRAS